MHTLSIFQRHNGFIFGLYNRFLSRCFLNSSPRFFFVIACTVSRSIPFPYLNCFAGITALTFQPLPSIAAISIAQNVINHRQLASNSITVSKFDDFQKSGHIRFDALQSKRTGSNANENQSLDIATRDKNRAKFEETPYNYSILWILRAASTRPFPMFLFLLWIHTFRIEAVQRTWQCVPYICASISFKTTKCIQCIRIKTSVTTMAFPNNAIAYSVYFSHIFVLAWS